MFYEQIEYALGGEFWQCPHDFAAYHMYAAAIGSQSDFGLQYHICCLIIFPEEVSCMWSR